MHEQEQETRIWNEWIPGDGTKGVYISWMSQVILAITIANFGNKCLLTKLLKKIQSSVFGRAINWPDRNDLWLNKAWRKLRWNHEISNYVSIARISIKGMKRFEIYFSACYSAVRENCKTNYQVLGSADVCKALWLFLTLICTDSLPHSISLERSWFWRWALVVSMVFFSSSNATAWSWNDKRSLNGLFHGFAMFRL